MGTILEELPLPKFDGENYVQWSIIMKTLMKAKGFWEIIQEGYEESLSWSSLAREVKREKKEKQYENCLALIANCKSATIAWKTLKDMYGKEPCETPMEERKFDELLLVEESMFEDFLLVEKREEDEECLIEETMVEESFYGNDCLLEYHQDEVDEECFMEEAFEECLIEKACCENEECPLKTPYQPYDDECFMEEAYCEPILMVENEEQPTAHYWQDCFFDKAQDDDTLKEECSMAEDYSHGVEEIDEKAEIIWDVDPYDIDDEKEMRAISSMLIKEKEKNKDDYLKGEIEDNEIAIDGLHGEMEASKDLESCLIEATICKEEPWEFLIMNEEMIALRATSKERLMWISTHQNIIRGDDFLFFGLFANATNECLLIRCVKDSLKAMENGGECLIKALLEDCIMDTTLKSLPWEKTLMKNLGHVDPNDDCKTLVKCDILSDDLCEEQFKVAYVISQCVAIYCLKVCVDICERVVWYNDYCEMIKTYSCGVCYDVMNARANDYLQTWFKHHVKDNDVKIWFEDYSDGVRKWLLKTTLENEREMKTKVEDPLDEGGVNNQKALNHAGETSTMEEIPLGQWKECHHLFLENSDFLLYDWRKRKRLCFFQLYDA